MSGWWITGGFAAVILIALVHDYVIVPILLKREYGRAWRAYSAAAFHPLQSAPREGNVRTLVRVATEVVSAGGKRGIWIAHPIGGGLVVHEFSREGVFSPRGPYFVKLKPLIWAPTGRRHLIESDLYPYGVPTSNPSGGRTREVACRILEWNTEKHGPLSLKQYAALQKHRAAPAPDKTPVS